MPPHHGVIFIPWHFRAALLLNPLSRVIDKTQAWQTKSEINASPKKDRRHSGAWASRSFWQSNGKGKKKKRRRLSVCKWWSVCLWVCLCVFLFVCMSGNDMLMRGGWQALCLHLSPPLLPESGYCLRRAAWVAIATTSERDGKGCVKMNSGAELHPNSSPASRASSHAAAALARQSACSSTLRVFTCMCTASVFVSVRRREMNR